jgi:hypothetical protein
MFDSAGLVDGKHVAVFYRSGSDLLTQSKKNEIDRALRKMEPKFRTCPYLSFRLREGRRRSWRYVRLILFIGLGGLGLFLGATQAGWQSALLGFASATTGLLTTFFKLQDTILQWIRKPTPSS